MQEELTIARRDKNWFKIIMIKWAKVTDFIPYLIIPVFIATKIVLERIDGNLNEPYNYRKSSI